MRTYTFLSGEFINPERTAALVITQEAAAVALSAADTPEEWAALAAWRAENAEKFADYAPPVIDLDAIDTAALNRLLIEEGSVVRALAHALFLLTNQVRELRTQQPITAEQFKAFLKTLIR